MKVRYDPEADILYFLIKEGEVEDTIEVDEDIFIEYGADREIVGIEVWQARKNVLPKFIEYLRELQHKASV
jgi:uncharacterized protein YuzE